MLCLLDDGHHSRRHSAAATAAAQDTAARNISSSIGLAEEPLTTMAAAAYIRLPEVGATQSARLFGGDPATATCGQQYPTIFGGNQELSSGGQQQLSASQGFCGQQAAANDTMLRGSSGSELGFNTMDYNFSELEPLWVRKEWPDILMRVAFVAPVVLLGIVGNLTIIWSICKFKSFRSKPTNIFILSMAIADLITALVCPLAALFTDIYQFYVLGSVLCRLEGSIKITCLLVSAYSLNWLSFIWLRYIVQPCRTRISIKQSWIILAGIWMASILMAAPLFCWRMLRSRQWRDLNEIWCCELIHISKYYWVVITFIIVYLPTFIMSIILVIILIQMDKFEAKLRRTRTNQSNSSLTINMKYRRRIVKVLILYLGISIVCWAPFQFSIIYRHFRKQACLPPGYSDFVFASQLLASVPGALNPFVFGFLSQPFRKIVTTLWMFKFLDKLLIWKGKPNSDNHQMEVKIVDRDHLHPQPIAANINTNHHHNHHHHQTTTRVRSGSTSNNNNNKRTTTTTNTHTTQQQQRAGHVASHRSGSRLQNFHSSKQQDSIHRKAQSTQAQSNGNTRIAHQHNAHQVTARGCDNAAYESTLGDDSSTKPKLDIGEGTKDEIGTTSFIQHHHHHHHHHSQQARQLERPMSPTSVVSMDSINIEENLGTNTIDEHHQYQQQQRQCDNKVI